MTVLGVDYGSRRVGLALGNTNVRIAQPLRTIDAMNWQHEITQVVRDHNVGRIVVGLPRGLDGQETAQTAVVRSFATMVQNAFVVPVSLQDEAATSEVAAERLAAAGRPIVKGALDAEAAAIILQDYLDGLDAQTAQQ